MKAGEVPIIEVAKLFPVELPGCVSDVCVCGCVYAGCHQGLVGFSEVD